MSTLEQYGLLLGLTVGTIGFVLFACMHLPDHSARHVKNLARTYLQPVASYLGIQSGFAITHVIMVTLYCFWPSIWKWPTCTHGP